MFASNNLSAADVAAVTGGNRNNGFGDGDGWWIILLALLFGWGRNGAFGGGYGSGNGSCCAPATCAGLQAGFNNQSVNTMLNGINSGICSLGYDVASQINGVNTNIMQNSYNTANAITQAQFAQQQSAAALQAQLAEAEKCCWEACYYKTVVKAMKEGDDREGRDEDEDDDEEWIEHDDMPNRNRTSSGRFRRGNTVGRRYPGNERRDWGGDMGSDGGTLQHGDMNGMQMTRDMSTMTPDEQLNHLKTDVETMWRDATPEQRKRIKESLTKWSTTLTV